MNRIDHRGFRIVRSPTAGAEPDPASHTGARCLPLDTPNPKKARHWLDCHQSWRPVVIAEPPAIRSPIHRLIHAAGGQLVAIGPTRTVYAIPVARPSGQRSSPAVRDGRASAGVLFAQNPRRSTGDHRYGTSPTRRHHSMAIATAPPLDPGSAGQETTSRPLPTQRADPAGKTSPGSPGGPWSHPGPLSNPRT